MNVNELERIWKLWWPIFMHCPRIRTTGLTKPTKKLRSEQPVSGPRIYPETFRKCCRCANLLTVTVGEFLRDRVHKDCNLNSIRIKSSVQVRRHIILLQCVAEVSTDKGCINSVFLILHFCDLLN